MKKVLLSIALLFSFSTKTVLILEQPYKINHSVIKKLDGIRYAMDTTAVTNIWEVLAKIKDLMNRQFTVGTTTGNISQLSKLEELQDPAILQQLEVINKSLKQEFVRATFKFIGDIQASKHLIFELMKSSCDHRKITNRTLLMRWAQIEGDEEKMFDITVSSLSQMELFLSDLFTFLFDLLGSCPRACNMFKKEKAHVYTKLQKFFPQEVTIFEKYCLNK